jgi:hypothetical protein
MVRDVYQAQQAAAVTAATEGANANSSSRSGNGTELLAKALPLLLQEHEYWTTGDKAVVVTAADGSTHTFSRCVHLVGGGEGESRRLQGYMPQELDDQ